MNYKVFTKLYECLVQPILLYGSSIWGLTEQRLINNVQNRAAKIFLGVSKRTSNVAVHGDLGWMSCLSEQKLEVIRFYYKLYNIEQHRILHKIKVWSKRKRRSWDFKVHKLLSDLSLEPLLDAGLSKKLFMIEVRSKIRICDEQFWFTKIWNDN